VTGLRFIGHFLKIELPAFRLRLVIRPFPWVFNRSPSFHINFVLRLLRMAWRGDKRLFNADSFCRF
jgi:hypothetical protein